MRLHHKATRSTTAEESRNIQSRLVNNLEKAIKKSFNEYSFVRFRELGLELGLRIRFRARVRIRVRVRDSDGIQNFKNRFSFVSNSLTTVLVLGFKVLRTG